MGSSTTEAYGRDSESANHIWGGYAWVHYDKKFRARLSEDVNRQWGELDNDLYMHTMKAE